MITTPAVLDTCPRCGTAVLAAHSGGVPVRADAEPLDERGELLALLDGRMTYDMYIGGLPRKPYLHLRYSWTISRPRKWKVVTDHKCPPGPHLRRQRTPPIDLIFPSGPPIPDNPPF
jgi:hypothetical protein